MWLSSRLQWHTLAAAAICAIVVAAFLLLLVPSLGWLVEVPGVVLLAVSASTVIGAAIASTINTNRCSKWQWHAIVASTWVFNPVLVIVVCLLAGWDGFLAWNTMPLGFALFVLLGRVRLGERIGWTEPRGYSLWSALTPWLLSRVIFLFVPAWLVSLQLALYLPRAELILPDKEGGGLITWFGLVPTFLKLYAICLAAFHQQLAVGMMLILFEIADWVSFLYWGGLVTGAVHTRAVLLLLLAGGVLQLRFAWTRLRLFPRWKVALARRRAELSSLPAEAERRLVDSSDSEDETGPGSLPEGFYGALGAILGFPQIGSLPSRREWLCGARCARVLSSDSHGDDVETGKQPEQPESATDAPLSEESGGAAASSASAATPPPQVEMAPLDVERRHAKCAICLEDICNGQHVRPLPKCGHTFHVDCLDQWVSHKVAENQESRCPTCRRPALSRVQDEGAVPISHFATSSRRQNSGSSRSSRSSGSRRSRRYGTTPFFLAPDIIASEEGILSPQARRGRSALQRYCTEPVFFQQVACHFDISPEFEAEDGEVDAYVLEPCSSPFGLPIDVVDRGPFLRWNQSSESSQKVSRGDHITEVDGESGTAEQLAQALAMGKHRLSIRRYQEFHVLVHRPDGQGRLGLDITHWYYSLQIRHVHTGPIQRWNASVDVDCRVLEGDCIVEVEGVRGTAEQLLQKIHGCLSEHLAEINFVLVRRRRRPAEEGRFESESPPPSDDSEAASGTPDSP